MAVLLFAICYEEGQVPYVMATAPCAPIRGETQADYVRAVLGGARKLAREVLPFAIESYNANISDEKVFYRELVKLIEQAILDYCAMCDGVPVEVFVPDNDEEDKSGMRFYLQAGLPDVGS